MRAYLRKDSGILEIKRIVHDPSCPNGFMTPGGTPLWAATEKPIKLMGWPDDEAYVYHTYDPLTEAKVDEYLVPSKYVPAV